jgi:hypothetical protein
MYWETETTCVWVHAQLEDDMCTTWPEEVVDEPIDDHIYTLPKMAYLSCALCTLCWLTHQASILV